MAELQLTDFSLASSSSDVAGSGMMTGIGSTLNQIANVLSGPVLYVILGLSIVMMVYGLGRYGHKQGSGPNRYAITIAGVGTFILTAFLKGFAAFLHGM